MSQFDPEKITFFAKTDARGKHVTFGIKAKDRQRHMYVVGKTGMGKSTLLENMAVQDIQNGEGMAFIDPHGSAAETLLEYVPEHRVNDVVYFAPFDLDHPISFNVMEDVGADKRHLVVSGLMSTFKKIWVDAWSARMEYILTNALLVLIEYPDTTLLSVNRLFNDKPFRLKVVEACTDAAVKSFWVDEFANYTERFAAEALPAIQNKIGQFTGNPLIRNIIGQPHSSFDFRKMMDEKKIVIMNLSKGLIGETNANLLGSMLTTRIYLAAMSRADLQVAEMKKMPNFYFYVDEFQSFANATFANILSEARKYHLNLIIAHQYIEQMEEEVRDAVFGNVGTTVAFRVGPFDAETLETVFTPRFLAADLVNLGFAQIYLTLMIDGIGSQPFSAVTLEPIALPSVSCKNMVIAASRKNYTRPRIEVEKIVFDLHTPVKEERKPATPKPVVKSATVGSDEKRSALAVAATRPVSNAPASSVAPKPVAPSPQPNQSIHTQPTSAPKPLAPVAYTGSNAAVQPSRPAAPAVSAPVKSNSVRPSSSDQGRTQTQTQTQTPARTTGKTATTSVDDLRSILARIAKVSTELEKPKHPQKEAGAIATTTPASTPPSVSAISPLQAALSALEAVDSSAPRTLPPRPVSVATLPTLSAADRSAAENLAAQTEAAFAQLDTTPPVVPQPPAAPHTADTSDTPSPFTPTTISRPTLIPDQILTSDSDQDLSIAHSPVRTPSSPHTAKPHPHPLDPKAVAKLLRQTAPTRSPFR